jgi:hypothetical protein
MLFGDRFVLRMSNFIDIVNPGDLMRNVHVKQMTSTAALSAALCAIVVQIYLAGINTALPVVSQAFTWSVSVA